jgi:ACT domain-containing protein
MRRTRLQLEQELAQIEKMISHGYTDSEIMKQLNLKRATYYIYKNKIFTASADLQRQKSMDVLSFEQQVLKDRLVRLFRILESRASDHNTKSGDVALCVSIGQEIAINILKLENEGLRVSSAQQLGGRGLNYVVKKAIEYTEQEGRNIEGEQQEVPTTTSTTEQSIDTNKTEEGQEPNNN